ncbi:hypothetical protein EBQ26_00240 [Allofranklinella schreckenbergeri]|uniref:Uncharacterized protein n=1 Tax=Allofranklinella schreckenbergeri TaxID=1076744 RepID=A0A3M6QEG4_9BURK|nr:hypothetical protein [Allofranklinella schreckenbergeri]RMX01255.1 hypothetical protein EBQ26_00240 [Allofranklinella schreckenbergeri]RRD42215.1 hypothetical protein EII18_06085 [Comamonadaceae bacterium OH3737_COT-264]
MSTDGNTGNVEAMHDFSPPPALAGRDEVLVKTAKKIKRVGKILRGVLIAITGLALLLGVVLAVAVFFAARPDVGWWALPLGLLVGLIVGGIVFAALMLLASFGTLIFLLPWARLLASACTKHMKSELSALGLRPDRELFWKEGETLWPNMLAVDTQRRALYLNMFLRDYERLVLCPNEILDVKVERESEIHTTTTHSGGTFSMFSSGIGGDSYFFGHHYGYQSASKSRSKSVEVERAFLEIHYQRACDSAPRWVAIPFGGDRREADSMAIAIRQL